MARSSVVSQRAPKKVLNDMTDLDKGYGSFRELSAGVHPDSRRSMESHPKAGLRYTLESSCSNTPNACRSTKRAAMITGPTQTTIRWGSAVSANRKCPRFGLRFSHGQDSATIGTILATTDMPRCVVLQEP